MVPSFSLDMVRLPVWPASHSEHLCAWLLLPWRMCSGWHSDSHRMLSVAELRSGLGETDKKETASRPRHRHMPRDRL